MARTSSMNPNEIDEEDIPLNQGLAVIGLIVTVFLPTLAYWQYGGAALLGSHPFLKLLLISGVGGAASYAILMNWGYKMLALIPGAVSGAGASAGLICYADLLGRTSLYSAEIALVQAVCGMPGAVLLIAIIWIRS